ncbi:MAG: glycosyltransferase family 2 protein, partial [Proteobacteria bacterium]|nr:glycosyltransferase family 2 protein [Pseudomonadota bacterium]
MAPSQTDLDPSRIAVVIPTYRARRSILGVLERIGPEVALIYVVDDCCPEQSGDLVKEECSDHRVRVIRHDMNTGVGGAVMTGYKAAIADGMHVIVKIDSDGQMDPALISAFAAPIVEGMADYTKGNRFYSFASLEGMPLPRIFGNAV